MRQKYSLIKKKPERGKQKNCRKNSLKLFGQFTLFPENSWIDDSVNFKNILVVVDPANGSLTGIAKEIFLQAGFGRVIEVNGNLNGDVNVFSGVADLEGRDRITFDQLKKSSGF